MDYVDSGQEMAPSPATVETPWSATPEKVIQKDDWVYRESDDQRVLRLVMSTAAQDDTREGALTYKMWYQVSADGGRSFGKLRLVQQEGAPYHPGHPCEPVWLPQSMYFPTVPPPLRASNREIMVPFMYWPLDKSGARIDPGFGPTFLYSGVLIGVWISGGAGLSWDLGQTVGIAPDCSTRGVFEPTIAELEKPGHFMMVMRGSNARHEDSLPGYKWVSFSKDWCRNWTPPEPWTYADGTRFYSPSSCSWLHRHTGNGKLYWFGNICEQNPSANKPRYPLVVGVVDERRATLGLERGSLRIIDTRDPGTDSPEVQFSNFSVRQCPTSGRFIVSLRRYDLGKSEQARREWPGNKSQWPLTYYSVEAYS